MRNASILANGEAMPAISRRAVMRAAWASYRKTALAARYDRFCRRLFGRVLRMAWINARADAARQAYAAAASAALRIAVPVAPTAFDEAMNALRYLPAHMSFERAAAAVRARFPLHA